MKPLPLIWQRLVDAQGQTCDRCGATHDALQGAVAKLRISLAPLGMEPTLETRKIQAESFKDDPAASNRIWIAGRPLEEWLGAQVGSSPCCSVCEDSECRTLEVGQTVYESIPEELIIKGALIAAAHAMGAANGAAAGATAHAACAPNCCSETRNITGPGSTR